MRTHGIRALQSKAKVFSFDLECPYCGQLLHNPDSSQYSFSIHESVPAYIKCSDCEKTSKTPKSVRSGKICQ